MKSISQLILSSLREIIFGLEDGVVSTLGVVTGIAEGTQDRYVILLSGVVVVAVESLSMAAGTYLSNKSQEQTYISTRLKRLLHRFSHPGGSLANKPAKDAFYMGISYVIGGIIPVLPYLFLPTSEAILASVLLALAALFLVGIGKAKLTAGNPLASGFEMAAVSLSAAGLGFLIGKIASIMFPEIRV